MERLHFLSSQKQIQKITTFYPLGDTTIGFNFPQKSHPLNLWLKRMRIWKSTGGSFKDPLTLIHKLLKTKIWRRGLIHKKPIMLSARKGGSPKSATVASLSLFSKNRIALNIIFPFHYTLRNLLWDHLTRKQAAH